MHQMPAFILACAETPSFQRKLLIIIVIPLSLHMARQNLIKSPIKEGRVALNQLLSPPLLQSLKPL